AINYGAILQAYSLQRKILEMGYKNEIIYIKNEKPKYFEEIKGYPIRIKIIKLLENFFRIFRYKDCKKAFNRFLNFSDENIISTKEISRLDELELENYQILITGSDQVFAFGTKENVNEIRFLNYDSDMKLKKVSFAASFGTYNLSNEQLNYMKNSLKKYDEVSVREEQGKNFLDKVLNIKSQVNIDPVFLHTKEEWESIIDKERIIKDQYILCYFLVSSPILENVIKKLKVKYNLPIVCVQLTSIKRIRADKYIFDAGPKEFLNLFKNAEFIVTTSFHGTAFALIFEKSFYSVLKAEYRTERFESLLKKVNLENRIIREEIPEISEIDYISVRDIIEENRLRNIDYLKKIFEN
ncbi:hypothetical protein FUSO5_10305, partial [Fusobacterium necrophorum BFTR-1]